MNLLLALSLLEIDISSGRIVQRQWDDPGPAPIGSLAKPFIALAYAQRHGFVFPRIRCRGCWKPDGHGEMNLVEAIAQSCNFYFDTLRAGLGADDLKGIALRFGLEDVDRAEPERLLRAFVELHRRRAEPGAGLILEGMRQAARTGTAKALHIDAYAKTGTAACTHSPKAPGDGLGVVLMPAPQPRTAFLIRVHGVPGSVAVRSLPLPRSTCPGCLPASRPRK